jgi:glycosyltransferase A (GT-A) superfamily protein (DUF2064 family)
VARAALLDTLDGVDAVPGTVVSRRILVLDGAASAVDDRDWTLAGWSVYPQLGDSLGDRVAHAFTDTALGEVPSVLIGMDTPQVDGALLARCMAGLRAADAVLGHATDGGWWLLGLRDPNHAALLRSVPTSRSDTGARTQDALAQAGLRVATAPTLSDVDTPDDARHVAQLCRPDARFVRAVNQNLPATTRPRPGQRIEATL